MLAISFFCVLSQQVKATNIDSLIRLEKSCSDLSSCYAHTLELIVASTGNDKAILRRYVPVLLSYMDSLDQSAIWVEGLNKIGIGYRSHNAFSTADSLLDKALLHCTTSKEFYEVYLNKAQVKQRMGKSKECISVLDTLLSKLSPADSSLIAPDFYLIRGRCFEDVEQLADALRDFIKVKEISKDHPRYNYYYEKAKLTLTETYLYLKSDQKLQKLHYDIRDKAMENKDYMGVLFATYPIILGHLQKADFEGVLTEGHQAIRLREEHKVSTAFGFIYCCMGDAFIGLNELDSASYYIEKGISFSQESKEYKELADNLTVKANLLVKQNKFNEAKLVMERAMQLRNYHDENLLNAYSEIQATLGNYPSAYTTLRKNWDHWEATQASLESSKIASLLLEDRFKLENEQQQLEFQHKMESQKFLATISFLVLSLLMIILYLWHQFRSAAKLRQLNHSLKQHNEALEQFAHITSHDLKEPVRNISNFSELLLRKSKLKKFDAQDIEYVSIIQSSANNLYKMIESIKQFTDVSFTNKNYEQVVVQDVISIVKENLQQFISERQAIVSFQNPMSLETVRFPKELLILVLQNLVQNGIKYNKSNEPHVEVSVINQGQKTIFKVNDNGIGIDEKYHDQIFVPFKTLQSKSDYQSSGLGLSICKNILENHGGSIWVEPKASSGSTFVFSILQKK